MAAEWRALLLTAIVAGVVALAYAFLSLQYPWGSLAEPGTGFYPFLVGIVFLLSSAGVAWEALVERPADTIDWPRGSALLRLAAVLATSVAYVILLVWLGHALAASVAALSLMTVMGTRRLYVTVPLALLMGFGSWMLFVEVLGVPLPKGFMG